MDIKQDWSSMVKAYEEFSTAKDSYSSNIEWPCIKNMMPDLTGKSILDIGCGTGIFTFLFEQYNPQKIVGIDLSNSMLEIARNKAVDRGSKAQFILGDASNINDVINEKFDFIFSSTTTHYIKNLQPFFKGIADNLADNGICILSIIHPIYSATYPVSQGNTFPKDDDWKIRYLDNSLRAYIQPWIEYNDNIENHLSISYHHLFSDYINAAVQAGLKVCHINEPLPPEHWKNEFPDRYEGFIETPTFMIMEFSK